MPLVINSLGADTHTRMHTDILGQRNSKKPDACRPMVGARIFQNICAFCDLC